jgi:hypothetical protein
MGSRTVWLLLLVVLSLGGVVLWQLGREERGAFGGDRPLFDGVRPERLQSVRIDHLERGLQLTLERDADGAWQIVDPLAFPAEVGVLERLFDAIVRNRATPVEDPDLAALSLAPPRAVLELVETLPAGPRTVRLELGAKDIDGKNVFARVDGVVVRTLLNVDTTLDRDLPDWRRHRILNVEPASVVEVRRSGKFALDPAAGAQDFAFTAGTTETGWRSTEPWESALDPAFVGALLSNACYLQARGFLADTIVEIADYGLDQPDLRIALVLVDGSEETLLLRHNSRIESWACMREGSAHVFRIEDASAVYLAVPSEAFLDTRLVREERADVERIELVRGDGTLALRRDGNRWLLTPPRGAAAGAGIPADGEAVLDLLGALEDARAARLLIHEQAVPFTASEPPLALRVIAKGRVHEIEFGPAFEAGPGVPGRLFRRAGENVVGVVEARIAALAERETSTLADRQMIKLPELGIAAIELSRGDFARVFVRDPETGRWSPRGVDAEAPKAFLKCIDRILSLRADVAVAPDAPFELREPWQVVVVDGGDVRTTYRLGALASDPAVHGFDAGQVRGIVTTSGLLPDLDLVP